ncbi:MAG: gamma-glutamyltransferase [Candidatus Eisenbacteria bacterium]|nr:gamma-glutamyltransferase [Candidatus Eisenbacteria bacterium]
MADRIVGFAEDGSGPARRRRFHPQRIAASTRGMIATAHDAATQAGLSAFAAGGNAMDAAAAAAFALGVCEPAASGLGGQTMILLRNGTTHRTIAVDGSSRAPHRAAPGTIPRAARRRGHLAATVPSTPAVLAHLLRRYGKLGWNQILAPAIELAETGYRMSPLQQALTRRELDALRQGSAGRYLLQPDGRPYRAGAVLRQPVLAATLRRLAGAGMEDFYIGEIGAAIHADMERHGGLIRRDDLSQIPWPVERRPVSCRFGPLRVVTFPPPGAGRTLVEMLNILANFPQRAAIPDTPEGALLLCEVIRRAFLDRRDRPHDPNLYPQVDKRRMVSIEYARKVARQIRRDLGGHGETTHLSAMDAEGNVVALTQSIESVYGSGEAADGLGFLYNNYMHAFEYRDISHPYYLRPNAVPWASVAPTIVFRGRRPWLAIGSPGSQRITPSILQVLLRLESEPPLEAVAAPRLHCSLKKKVSLEAARMRSDIPEALERRGYRLDVREPYSFYLGCVQLVLRQGRRLVGVADPRRDGSAGGPRE